MPTLKRRPAARWRAVPAYVRKLKAAALRLVRRKRAESYTPQPKGDKTMIAPTMTLELARAAAADAGRRNAAKNGRPPRPWTREDLDTATSEFHRLCRLFKLGPYGDEPLLPRSQPKGTKP